MMSNNIKLILLHFSRLLAGIIFIYSGFVKGIDPLGSTYKFVDYFVAFNIEFLETLAFPLSILLSAAEMLIGLALVSGIHMIFASWAVFLFMAFFTILTFIIALTDPVADCGCFGDAIILTNWETFWKNVVLMVFVTYLFLNRKIFKPFFYSRLIEWTALTGLLIITLGIFFYSYLNLPVIDYRPFSVGTDIEEKMSIPPDAPVDEYEITLYYEKDGEVQPFSADNLPGPEWEWVRTESKLVKKGYEPAITEFYIESIEDGWDYTEEILQQPGYTFLLVSYSLDRGSEKNLDRINRIAEWSFNNGMDFICLTASPESQIAEFIDRTGAGFRFYHSDEITLKTVIRSNPGLVLLHQGTILAKWHNRNIPHADELKENLLSYSLELQQDKKNDLVTIGYIAILILILTLLKFIRPTINKRFSTTH